MREFLTALRMIPAAGRIFGGLFIFLAIAWVVAGLLHFPRWIACLAVGVLFGIFLLFSFLRKRKEKKNAKEFEGSLGLQGGRGAGKEEIREALGELSQRWEESIREIKASGLSIYDLPWYMLIGEPQSGKSTTIENSGLEFPIGTDSLSGSGGTRNCDWWFTNEAVLLDTAGRFTFQESNAPDQHEWSAFLKLLSKHRKQCPINGVIVVIPVTSLVEDPVDIIEVKAKNIRQKLQHLQKALGIRFPVFILITKADRILGFTEFFSRLDPIDQRQLFGWSSKSSQPEAWDPRAFDGIYNEIFTRVHKLRLKFFHGEQDPSRIDKLFVFPEELAALREPLAQYFNTIFGGSRYEEPLMLRGFYLTSGIQQGRPFALACRDLLRVRAGDPEGVLENLEQVFAKSRAFFIRDFYEKKVFPEQGLVSKTREAIRKESTRRRLLYGGVGVLAPLLILLMSLAYFSLKSTVGAITNDVQKAGECLNGENGSCGAKEAFELIQSLEGHKKNLQSKFWARWMFLQGKNNEVVATYIPAMQTALLNRKIVGPLQKTFIRRAEKIDWSNNQQNYRLFRDGFMQLLRFELLNKPGSEKEEQKKLREGLGIKDLLLFCNKTRGMDKGAEGKSIDQWLMTSPGAPGDANRLFKAVLRQFPKVAGIKPTSTEAARNSMLRFWTIESLAGWDYRLLEDSFEQGFLGFFDKVQDLNASSTSDRGGTLKEFVELIGDFDTRWQAAEELMRKGRSSAASEDESPGRTPDQWEAFCLADFHRIDGISPEIFDASEFERTCQHLPGQFGKLQKKWNRYGDLYDGSPGGEDAESGLGWSKDAVQVYNLLMEYRKVFGEDEIRRFQEELEKDLKEGRGDSSRFRKLEEAEENEKNTILTKLDEIPDFKNPSLTPGDILWAPAELGVAERILPPAGTFFETLFGEPDESIYKASWARDFAGQANDFLVWTQDSLEVVRNQTDTGSDIDKIDGAIYAYVDELVTRTIDGLGSGGGGSYYISPKKATRASSWSGFLQAVQSWNYEGHSSGRSGRGASTGVDSGLLEDLAKNNERLNGLSNKLAHAITRSRRSGGSGPAVAAGVSKAIEDFKNAVTGLDSNPLEAWKVLAEEKGRLRKFHSFSRAGSSSRIRELRVDLEEHGAELLVQEIQPEFKDAYRRYWRNIDSTRGYFPLITQKELNNLRREYLEGYRSSQAHESRGRGSRHAGGWKKRSTNPGQGRKTLTFELPTATMNDLDDVFRGMEDLISDFALVPILSSSEKKIDFVGPAAARTLRSIRAWKAFVDAQGDGGREPPSFGARLQSGVGSRGGIFLLQEVNEVDFFRADSPIRSSTEQYVKVPLDLVTGPLSIRGKLEGRAAGIGELRLEGDELKLPFFVMVAANRDPKSGRKKWEVRVNLPSVSSSNQLIGIFELNFPMPIPDVLPDDAGREFRSGKEWDDD